MTPCTRSATVIAFILCISLPAWGQEYLLYAPQPATPGQETPSQEGVLVKEILIRKGDTLSGLSRKFSGHGKYYPQILLFNTIKNPDLIYAGNKLRVPLSHKESPELRKHKVSGDKKSPSKAESGTPEQSLPISSQSSDLPLSDLRGAGTGNSEAIRPRKKSAAPAKKSQPPEYPAVTDSRAPLPATQKSASPSSPEVDSAISGQKLFEAAVSSYRRDDCRNAIEQFDRYLADNSGSPLAADATLYKADCYLKLSAQ
jgi:LysM repeat protein